MKATIANKIKSAPKEPGVYIFYGNKNVRLPRSARNDGKRERHFILYVGKAANLHNRLKSYLKITDHKTEALHQEATSLKYITLKSDIEALIEESRLIKELKPKYNVLFSDDKSYSYVAFTRETYSKVFVTHKSLSPKLYPKPNTRYPILIGPFTDGGSLRLVMKLLRRQFPYCTCTQSHLRDCLNAQIGKCLGFCCAKISIPVIARNKMTKQSNNNVRSPLRQLADRDDKKYKQNIKMIKAILKGQSKKLLKSMRDENEKEALENILNHRDYLNESVSSTRSGLREEIGFIKRVECYDNSHLTGKEAVGAMTALVKAGNEWLPDKNSYRKFKIKSSATQDDPKMMYEIVSRRLNHPEWPYPDLIIIDGGITQYNAALRAQRENEMAKNIKIISFAKPNQKILGIENPTPELKKVVQKAIYQTHNFVIRYHRQIRRKEFISGL